MLLVIPMPLSVDAQGWGTIDDEVFGERITPLAYNIDYNGTTEILRVNFYHPETYVEGWMRGMQIIELIFSADFKPKTIDAIYVNGSDVIDMIYLHPTYTPNYGAMFTEDIMFWRKNDTDSSWYYADAVYLLAFIHTFANHTFENLDSFLSDHPLVYYDRPFIDGPNDPEWDEDELSAHEPSHIIANDFIASDDDTGVQVMVAFDDAPGQTDAPLLVFAFVMGASVGIVVLAIIVVIKQMSRE